MVHALPKYLGAHAYRLLLVATNLMLCPISRLQASSRTLSTLCRTNRPSSSQTVPQLRHYCYRDPASPAVADGSAQLPRALLLTCPPRPPSSFCLSPTPPARASFPPGRVCVYSGALAGRRYSLRYGGSRWGFGVSVCCISNVR